MKSNDQNEERIRFVDHVMSQLGFIRPRHPRPHQSARGPYAFIDALLYVDHQATGDIVAIHFPAPEQANEGLEVTMRAKFNNRVPSPEWRSLRAFEEDVGDWIRRCREGGSSEAE